MSNSTFFIVYPGGDRTKLKVIELSFSCEYEISEYDQASRQTFHSFDDASEHAINLARENDLTYVKEDSGPAFLD
jgi:hypothetical protein